MIRKPIYFLLILSLVSCQPNVIVLIDNPKNKAILVSVDDEKYSIAPRTIAEVLVRPGIREFRYDTIVESKSIEVNYKYLINTSRRNFYLDHQIYITDFFKLGKRKAVKKVKVEGYLFEEPSRIYDREFVIEGRWDFGSNEIFPSEINESIDNFSSKYGARSRSKLFTDVEIISEIELYYGGLIYKTRKEKVSDELIKEHLEINDEQFDRSLSRFTGI